MALTVTLTHHGIAGDLRYVRGSLSFDASYPTGGESLTAANLGLRVIDAIHIHHTKGVSFEYDYTNSKILAYNPGVTVGAAGALTLDDFVMTGVAATPTAAAIGLSANSANTTVCFGVMPEIISTGDLSTITGVRFFAWGT